MKFNFLLILVSLLSIQTFAQVGGRGGGREKEIMATQLLLDLIPYLESEKGFEKFPEIAQYNRETQVVVNGKRETFSDVLRSIHFVMVNGPVRDLFNGDRDCVTYLNDPKRRITTCNENAFPALTLDNQRALYAFVLHEAFIATGIEKPVDPGLPSIYPVASRLTFYKKTIKAWAPGDEDLSAQVDAETNFFSCRALDSHFRVWGSMKGFFTGKPDMNFGSEEADEIYIQYSNIHLEESPVKLITKNGTYFVIHRRMEWDNMHQFLPHSDITVKIKGPWFKVSDEDLTRVELRGSITFTLSKGSDPKMTYNADGSMHSFELIERPSEPESIELVCKVNPKVFVERKE
jgi:hypothetical protein